MIKILSSDLKHPIKFRNKVNELVNKIRNEISQNYRIDFEDEELSDLILSACRLNEFKILKKEGKIQFLDEDALWDWINKKLIPSTITLNLDDPDVLKLLIFCLEITYKMFQGGTKATITQKGFRERRRTFEAILVDQFIGKLGEIFVKKFLEKNYSVNIDLDWEISPKIEKHRKDILNTDKYVSIKTSPALASIWAEADVGYDYGIMVKCAVPFAPIMQFFIEVCGFSKLLDFAENKISVKNGIFKGYIEDMRERIREYKCGEIKTSLKGFICGYFKTSNYSTIKKGENLIFLGEVREERYLVPISELKWTKEDWKIFLFETGILSL